MSIVDEPDDTPGASNAANPPAGGGQGGADAGGGGGANGGDGGGGGSTPAVAPESGSRAPYIVGVAVLLFYGIFLFVLVGKVPKTEEVDWGRYIYLFSGVEALAFGAAGFFFGREVNRGRAEAAETQAKAEAKRATKAENKAADANAKAAALSDNVRAMFEGTEEAAPVMRGFGPPGAEAHASPAHVTIPAQQARGVIALADRWFPRP